MQNYLNIKKIRLLIISISIICLSLGLNYFFPVSTSANEQKYTAKIVSLQKNKQGALIVNFQTNYSPKKDKIYSVFAFSEPISSEKNMVYIGINNFLIEESNLPIGHFRLCLSPIKANLEIVGEVVDCKDFEINND